MSAFVVFCVVVPVALVSGMVIHECGHWLAAVALRFEPKIVCLGSGRQVFQMQALGVHLVLRAVPLGGRVMFVPVGRERRNAMAAFLAAGSSANLLAGVAAVLAWYVWGRDDIASGTAVLAFAGAQAMTLQQALVPVASERPERSDGALLRAWARRRDVYLLDRAYAPLVAHLPPRHRPARTADFAEVLFHSVRSDRLEPWGREQAIAGIEAVLARERLNPYERMAALKRLLRYLAEEEAPPATGPWGPSRNEELQNEDLEGGLSG